MAELSGVRGYARLEGSCNLLDCLSAFTDTEILDGVDKYGCKTCTLKRMQRMQEETEEDAKEKMILKKPLQSL